MQKRGQRVILSWGRTEVPFLYVIPIRVRFGG